MKNSNNIQLQYQNSIQAIPVIATSALKWLPIWYRSSWIYHLPISNETN